MDNYLFDLAKSGLLLTYLEVKLNEFPEAGDTLYKLLLENEIGLLTLKDLDEKLDHLQNSPEGLEKVFNYLNEYSGDKKDAQMAPEKFTKDYAEKAIEKKQLAVKATESNIGSGETEVQIKRASKANSRENYKPTKAQLEIINSKSLDERTEDNTIVLELQASSLDLDKSFERMSEKAIKSMVKMSVDKPIFLDHDWSVKSAVGRIFKAKNEKGNLIQWAYFPINAKTAPILEGVFDGTINRLSVGFSVAWEDMVCDSCEKSIIDWDCEHYPGAKDEKGNLVTVTIRDVKRFHETSFVGVPCNDAAGVRKSHDGEIPVNKSAIDLTPIDPENTIVIGDPYGPGATENHVKQYVVEQIYKATGVALPMDSEKIDEKQDSDTIDLGNTIQDNNAVMDEQELKEKAEAEAEAKEQEVQDQEPESEISEESENEAPEVPEAPEDGSEKDPKQEPEVKQEIKLEMPAEMISALSAIAESIKNVNSKVESLEAKVDLHTKAPTPSNKKELEEAELTKIEAEHDNPEDELWFTQLYGFKTLEDEDLGGQE